MTDTTKQRPDRTPILALLVATPWLVADVACECAGWHQIAVGVGLALAVVAGVAFVVSALVCDRPSPGERSNVAPESTSGGAAGLPASCAARSSGGGRS